MIKVVFQDGLHSILSNGLVQEVQGTTEIVL